MNGWQNELDRFPELLRQEILEERPGGTEKDRAELRNRMLVSPTPVRVELTREFVAQHDWLLALSHPEARQRINERFGLSVAQSQIYDKDPERVLRYAALPAETAKPSVMIDGEVWWGCGRCVAAMLRGDNYFYAWQLATVAE